MNDTPNAAELTDEQLRIAIAKWCGWTHVVNAGNHPVEGYLVEEYFKHSDGRTGDLKAIPNYLGDLNAMHSALGALESDGSWSRYQNILKRICRTHDTGNTAVEWFIEHNATARQRALALYLTIKQKDV